MGSAPLYMGAIGAKGGKIGGKRSLETMTPEERSARAKKAAMAAAKKRTAEKAGKGACRQRDAGNEAARRQVRGPSRKDRVSLFLKSPRKFGIGLRVENSAQRSPGHPRQLFFTVRCLYGHKDAQ
jgi:hypothetical protein